MEDAESRDLPPDLQRKIAQAGKEIVEELQKEQPSEATLKEIEQRISKAQEGKTGVLGVVQCPHCGGPVKLSK